MKKAFEIEYKHKKVEIHIIDFVGEVRNINGTPDLFSLSYNSNINDKGQYILATEAEINIYEDAYFNIDELKTVGETDILIKYLEYDELVWQGFALPDFFQTGITKPRVLRIVATDRLGVLKDIANTSVSNTPKEIIEECLLQTGLTLPVEIRSVDNYLTSTTIERERIEGISAYDIIRAFMVQFNSKIVQYKNKWWVVNKKLLEDGFLGQEIIDIDLVYLDGQREIKPTASDISLYLEFGGSKRYPDNALFREWDGNKFVGWESKGGQIQRLNYKSIIDYNQVGYGTFNANFGEEGTTPSLYCRYKMLNINFENEGNYFNNQNGVLSNTFPVKYRDGDTEVTLRVDFTTVSANVYLPFVLIMKTPDGKFYAINRNGVVVNAYKEVGSTFEVDLTKVDPIRVSPVESNYLDAVQSLFEATFTINQNALGVTSESAHLEFMVYSVGYRVPDVGSSSAYLDVLFNSIQVIFNKSEDTHKGLIFKTKQGGDKFSKVRETETTLFSDKINQGVNGYFYNYKYDDTSITNLPKEYLLEMTRQMAGMFCSARDFYSLGGKFKVNPLARYRCGDKYFVLVGGVSHRENSEIDIEEIVSNSSLTRTDYIYTYFEDSKDNIKSIGTASGSGGAGGTGGGVGGGMTSEQLEMLTNLADWWKLDEENDAIYSEKSVYSLKGVSALGLGKGGGGGGGDGVDMLDSWANYTEAKADFYAPASLLVPFRNDTLSRLASLEAGGGGGGDIDIAITGSGNAVTGVSKDGNTLTFAKSSTFALSTHNHDTLYKPIDYVSSWSEITDKPATFTPSAHTHTIANVTGLQGTLDSKATQSDIDTAIDNIGVTSHIENKANPHEVTTSQIGAVDLTTSQTIGGAKTFTGNVTAMDADVGSLIVNAKTYMYDDLHMYGGDIIAGYVEASLFKGTKVDFGNGFTIEPSGTELVFKYNGVIKQRMLSDGTILATAGITALST